MNKSMEFYKKCNEYIEKNLSDEIERGSSADVNKVENIVLFNHKFKEFEEFAMVIHEWNDTLERYKKAEKLAESDPVKFEKFINEFNKVVNKLSYLLSVYKTFTGSDMDNDGVDNGFKLC